MLIWIIDKLISKLIITITKFSNLIGYQLPWGPFRLTYWYWGVALPGNMGNLKEAWDLTESVQAPNVVVMAPVAEVQMNKVIVDEVVANRVIAIYFNY